MIRVGNRRPGPIVDKVTVRVIAISQLLISLCGLLILPFAFMYSGAGAWPSRFQGALLYFACGFGTAIFLFSRKVARRRSKPASPQLRGAGD
jgi:hypothetical protein